MCNLQLYIKQKYLTKSYYRQYMKTLDYLAEDLDEFT